MICVFDVESIPDFHLLARQFGYEGDALEIIKSAFEAQMQKSGSEFLPPCFHRIVSIASVVCDEYGHFIKVGHFGQKFIDSLSSQSDFLSSDFLDHLESTLLYEFWSFFNQKQPKLVSFNGRGFDLIALTLRAMRYNISAYGYFEQDNPAFNKNKWENYRQRYAERFHTDLLDALGAFGAVRNLNLDSVCQMLNLVGKYDMSGDQVHRLYLGSEDKKQALMTINHYCHSDVLNTYWLYLKYELLKGELLESDYYTILQGFLEKLPSDKPYSDIFKSTIQAHLDSYTAKGH
uniref:Polysaccharide biosynthesis protein n=1 Tax=uncultured Helicobacter sp. TaxID=175537 RepID=A0A650ELT3_9HELI|nr:polysaccharide biosynthesis protein [uncultured Helicobacter sp.]